MPVGSVAGESIGRTRMKTRTKVFIVTLVVGIPAFMLEPNGPLGGFWVPAAEVDEPSGVQLPLFMLLGVLDAVMFGLGASFVVFGYSLLRSVGTVSMGWTVAAYASISWILLNWWAHDGLHVHNGLDLNGLLRIDYGFHTTLMAAGLIVALYFTKVLRQASVGARTQGRVASLASTQV